MENACNNPGRSKYLPKIKKKKRREREKFKNKKNLKRIRKLKAIKGAFLTVSAINGRKKKEGMGLGKDAKIVTDNEEKEEILKSYVFLVF